MEKSLLIISYHFPPDAAVGALRTQKYVKYLPEFGWQPYVLTVRSKHYERTDPRRLEDVNGATIFRTPFFRTPRQALLDLRAKYLPNRKRRNGEAVTNNTLADSKILPRPKIVYFLAELNWFPDDKLYWLLPAVIEGYKAIKQHRIRHILVSSPPHTTVIIGYLLHLLTGAQLMVDFRDPWILSYAPNDQRLQTKPRLLVHLERFLERIAIESASDVICENDYFRNALAEQYKYLTNNKFHSVNNGFDTDDFQNITEDYQTNTQFTISYIGTFYIERTPESFIKALRMFMIEKKLTSDDVCVKFIGDVYQAKGVSVQSLIDQENLTDIIELQAPIPYAEAVRVMAQSDVLLLLVPQRPLMIPAKTYEYLGSRKPILLLAEDGATTSLVNGLGAGVCVDPADIDGIRQGLDCLYTDYKRGLNRAINVDTKQFSRRNQTSKLVDILEKSLQ